MSDKFVIVHRSYDPVQIDLLGQLLRENGIHARVLGTRNGALIGVGQNILEMHLAVPQAQAGEATDFLEAFFEDDGEALLAAARGAEPDARDLAEDAHRGAGEAHDPDDPDGRDLDHRNLAHDDEPESDGAAVDLPRPLFAAGVALMLGVFGAGHLYARRPLTALALIVGQALALRAMLEPAWHDVATGLIASVALIACDVIGAQWAIYALARDKVRASAVRQLFLGALMLVAAHVLGDLIGQRVPAPQQSERPGLIAPGY